MGPSAAEKADHSGPLEKRVISKNWKVRSDAFDELTKMCTEASVNSSEGFFVDHVDKWNIYLKDTNPGALEKVLDCLAAFLKKVKK
mmetsp:Transcript_34357/g.52650  ORF Transcript_34357/g.52650 Transcript_34357/m.52650 type:complete len:86 (-) Transcript_34357:6614-6871(-)